MNVLLLGLNYTPEPIGIGPFTAGLAEFLQRRGHGITVIAGTPYYPDWCRHPDYPDGTSHSVENGVEVWRVPHFIPNRPTAARRIVHYLTFAASARRIARHAARTDLVIAIAPSLVAAPVALAAARRFDALSWLHIQDFEVEAAIATGLAGGKLFERAGLGFESRVLRGFDRVSTISPAMRRKAIAKGAAPAHVIETRNWADRRVAPRADHSDRLRKALGLDARPVAPYSGNLARKQGCAIIADAARLLAADNAVQIVVCGAGTARAELEDAAQRLPNLVVCDLQPRERLPELLAMADMHILTQIAGAADLVLPSKLANMLASGRPVIATADSGTDLAREVEGCGLVVSPGDPAALAKAINHLANDPCLRDDLGQKAARRADRCWTESAVLESFAQQLESAVQDGRNS